MFQIVLSVRTSTDTVSFSECKAVCPKCKKIYSSYGSMKAHKSMDCGKVPGYSCNTCDRKFKRMWSLKRHSIICKNVKLSQ